MVTIDDNHLVFIRDCCYSRTGSETEINVSEIKTLVEKPNIVRVRDFLQYRCVDVSRRLTVASYVLLRGGGVRTAVEQKFGLRFAAEAGVQKTQP